MELKFTQVIIFCADVIKLSDFYKRFFGFVSIGEVRKDWAVLQAGSIEIAFHQIGKEYQTKEAENFRADSNTKLVFEIDTDISAFHQLLSREKIDVGEPKSFPGMNYLLFDGTDPEGNVFQVKQSLG